MAELIITTAKMQDAEELNRIEQIVFPSAEAASLASYKYRIEHISDWFLKAEENGRIVGLICCRPVEGEGVTDDMYEPEPIKEGKVICILSVATEPELQRRGIAAQLIKALIEKARERGMAAVSLACKDRLVHYYAKFGFELNGISASEHGGVRWNDMILRF